MLRQVASRSISKLKMRSMSSIATIRIAEGQPSNRVNSLGLQTRKSLLKDLAKASSDPNVKAIIITNSTHSPSFCAGADIKEFSDSKAAPASPSLHDVLDDLENMKKPTIAAIQGVALGGGLELALACHYRVAVGNAKVGLPEVKLGIIPGAGGTQRLPRVANVPFALDVITSGRMVKAEEALGVNLLDGICPKDVTLEIYANTFANDLIASSTAESLKARNLSLVSVGGDIEENKLACDAIRKNLPKKHMGGEAVHGAVDAVVRSFTADSFEQGMQDEVNIFLDLLTNSTQGAARRHVFFAERSSTAVPKGSPKIAKLGSKIGVIGAGTMGSGIATCFLRAGYDGR